MDPRNAHRGFREREERRKNANKQKVFIPKEDKMNANNTGNKNSSWLWIVVILAVVLFCCAGTLISGFIYKTVTEVPATTEAPAPTTAPTEVPAAIEAPAPVVEVEDPVVACETIEVSTDDGKTWLDAGIDLETEEVYDIGDRVTFTARSILVPNKEYNEELSNLELKKVETTWLKVRLNACETKAVVFTHDIELGDLKFDEGVLFELGTGYQEFNLRNGEIILWFDQEHQDKDITKRIVEEIRKGNFDIKSKLDFAVTDNLKDILPADILEGVQIVLIPN